MYVSGTTAKAPAAPPAARPPVKSQPHSAKTSFMNQLGKAKKKICVFPVTSKKKLG